MAQGIKTLGAYPSDPVANPVYLAGADKSADVLGIDLGAADYWSIVIKLNVKTNTGTLTAAAFMSDAANGTGNIHYVTGTQTMTTANTGMLILHGMGNRLQQYLNIDLAIGTAVAYDYEVFATPVAARAA